MTSPSELRIPVKHDNVLGMDRSTDSYLIGSKAWQTQFGFRVSQNKSLVQVPRKLVSQSIGHAVYLTDESGNRLTDESGNYLLVQSTQIAAVTASASVPNGGSLLHNNFLFSHGVFFLQSKTTAVELLLASSAGIGDNSSLDLLVDDNTRWTTTLYEGKVYFTNLLTPIHVVTEGPYVARLNGQPLDQVQTSPAARYIETFFDHLFIADVSYKGRFPNRLQWSDLYNFHIWNSTRSNEADCYDILDSENVTIGGITGCKRLGNELFTYTSTGIYVTNYVGFPSLFKTDIRIPDVGNDFRYGLVTTERMHFFPSFRWRIFFNFNGEQVTPFGEEIAEFFFADLNSDIKLQQKTFGYTDTSTNELVWTYVSTQSSGDVDKEIVYHLKTKVWYSRACEAATTFFAGGRVANTISSLSGTIAGLSGTVQDLEVLVDTIPKLWGTGKNELLLEGTNLALAQPLPYLETNDFIFDDFWSVKEVETLIINAILGTSLGIEVYFSSRNLINDAVTYNLVNQVWDNSLKENRLSLPRGSGKIFRYKFQPKPQKGLAYVDNVKWTNFVQLVYGLKAEK